MKAVFYLILLAWSIPSKTETILVTSTADADICDQNTCTLRGAINQAIAIAGSDTIAFDIPADTLSENYITGGSGTNAYLYWLIQPSSKLPELQDITLDGTTAGISEAGNPTIVIDGSLAGTGTNENPMDGLTLVGDVMTLGVALIYWDEAGLRISSGSNNTVSRSWLGLNLPYGLAAAPNKVGIQYDSVGNNNRIRGTLGISGNVVSGNTQYGISTNSLSSNLEIAGNLIGTDPSGEIAVPNNIGVYLRGRNHQLGTGTVGFLNNLISGNQTAVQISNYPIDTLGNSHIENNIIGLNINASTAIPNVRGVFVQRGRGFTIHNNTIAGNDNYGVSVASESEDVIISSNRFGINFAGGAFSTGAAIRSSGAAKNVVVGPDNIITENFVGVQVVGFSNGQTHINRNQIYNNDNLGIDLGDFGFTENDVDDLDAGPNRLQNFPNIQAAQYDANSNRIQISFQIDSQIGASDYPLTIDIYAADLDGEEGQTWLAETTYTADQFLSGLPVFRTLLTSSLLTEGDLIVTTATDAGGRTSEFSPAFILGGDADFSIACQTNQVTTNSTLTCSLNCQAEAVNGWSEEAQLSCLNPDSSCNFFPTDEIAFNNPVVPFVLEINHAANNPGVYASVIVAGSQVQEGTIERQETLTIKQLADSDYIFNDGFDGIICQ